jgi:hypothetical protein
LYNCSVKIKKGGIKMATSSFLRLPEFKTDKEIDGLIKALENNRKPELTGVKAEKITDEKRIRRILDKKR